jgi:hypothetical protein
MRADNSIHLVTAARQRHEHTRAKAIVAMHELDRAAPRSPSKLSPATPESLGPGSTRRPISKTRSAGCATSAGPNRTHRYPRGSAPATTPCGCASKSPTAATVNSPTRTSDYAVSSPAPSARAATTIDTGPADQPNHIAVR